MEKSGKSNSLEQAFSEPAAESFTEAGFRFFVDRGGTFTDIIGVGPDQHVYVHKLLSQNPNSLTDPTRAGIEAILTYAGAAAHGRSDEVRVGTTVATNALLTRSGAKLVLLTNKGLKDALSIGYQARDDIFALEIRKATPLYYEVMEIDCRMTADGQVSKPVDEEEVLNLLRQLKERAPDAVLAVVFMHSYLNGEQEDEVARLATSLGFTNLSLSHKVSPLIKYVPRGDTTCVDAYLNPPLKAYTERLAAQLEGSLSFMKSDGGLTTMDEFSGKDALLSGPAGGVVGAVKFATARGEEQLIAFDMGGTSTDVSYFAGEFEKQYETIIASVRVRSPMMAVHTVAAGGGSILAFDGARLTAGPESAGSYPGPSSYGHGGPLTITDANLILGRISVAHFPKTFGKKQDAALDTVTPRKLFQEMGELVAAKTGLKKYLQPEVLAYGFLTVAVEKMCRAIARVSTEQGHDVSQATLVAFGGAGGQHACLIAERLGIKKIIVSPLAGVLSAYGIGVTAHSASASCSWRQTLATLPSPSLQTRFEKLRESAQRKLKTKVGAADRLVFLRYQGSDCSTAVKLDESPSIEQVRKTFEEKHEKIFGFHLPAAEIVIEDLAVELKEESRPLDTGALTFISYDDVPAACQKLYAGGRFHDVTPLTVRDLHAGLTITGPALLAGATATTVIEPGWRALVEADGGLTLIREEEGRSAADPASHSQADPVLLELFNNIFMAIAEEMGTTLQHVSHSVNIKERLDFSCAIFDGEGRLIANAPHMPVHLGSMGEAVVALMKARAEDLQEGQVYVSNNPYNGGTHLPDITAISPLFAGESKPLFFVASRGHHADIGGITPGSMPPLSTTIEEEGALLDNLLIMQDRVLLEDSVRRAFLDNRYPARNIEQTMSDLKAQIAANLKGIQALKKLMRERGLQTVQVYMQHIRANAALAIREILQELEEGAGVATMDDGSTIAVQIKIDKTNKQAVIDFTGTSPQTMNNFNTPRSVVRAAVLYVFRTLIKHDIPLNDGCSEPLKIIIPEGSLLSPSYPRAVVAGNVETSQIIVDLLYQCLGRLANSQGTMNNLTFGNERYQYYETICGGSGAGPGFAGSSAVQTHMTNSRLTDPEILETRYPVMLEEFSIRTGSGGAGLFPGGDGACRTLRFLENMEVSILSGRRRTRPEGLMGGGGALSGRTTWIKAGGESSLLSSTDHVLVQAGDCIRIETPGGGGYGARE